MHSSHFQYRVRGLVERCHSAVLREKPVSEQGNVFGWRMDPSWNLWKNSFPRHKTRDLEGIKKGNPSSKRSGRRKEIPDLSISNLTSAEHALIRNRGRRFEIATFSR